MPPFHVTKPPYLGVFCNITMHVSYDEDRKLHKIKGMGTETKWRLKGSS
jgi:hypothetical protein